MTTRLMISYAALLFALASLARSGEAQTKVLVRPRAIVLEMANGQANGQTVLAQRLEATLTRAGYRVQRRDYASALDTDVLAPAVVKLVVLPDARAMPHALHKPLEQFLKRGGDLIAFGLPAWGKPLLKSNGRWIEAEEYARSQAAIPPAHPFDVLSTVPLSQWSRSSDQPEASSSYEIVPQEAQGPVLHAVVGNLTSWDTIATPPLAAPFAAGTDRTVFAAKGGPRSRVMSVEWVERDGSRWIAIVPLTPQWRRYELAPEAFRFYQSNPQRGGANDHFHPENAVRLALGIAFTHGESQTGRHEWWVSHLGTASASQTPLSSLTQEASIDGLYPGYKSFRIRDNRIGLRAPSRKLFPMNGISMPQGALYSPHPRPSGAGFDKGRHTRFVPLLEARATGSNFWRGVPGALYIHDEKGRYRGGRWAVFGITDATFLSSPAFLSALEKLAVRLHGPLLFAGGTDWYTVFPNRPLRIGARLSNRAITAASDRLQVQIRLKQSTTGRVVWQHAWTVPQQNASATWTPPRGQHGPWQVEVRLRRGNEVLDELAHEVHVWDYAARPQFVTAANGQFRWNGKPWKPHGVNYMPSSGIARDWPEEGPEFELWMGKAPYDPEVIARDLGNIRRLGLNAVSIFIYGGSRQSGNLLDILRQCDARGIKVNLSLRPGTPLDFAAQWAEIRPIIEMFHLNRCDTIFAYDLAWEPSWGNHEARRAQDAPWTAWVRQRYGGIDAAERAWGFPAPRAGDALTNPTDEQVSHDGAWRKLVIDYRRFLAALLREKYGHARQTVRGLDSKHMVSFRMSEAGNPTYRGDAFLPYDFPGLAEAVDFLAPEAYGRIGGWESTRPGWFEVAYARAVAPQLPVVWAEVGMSMAVPGLDEPSPDRLKLQAEFFRAFYRMMKASGSNGIFYWWSPGGFRTGENSDFGILNPDGTDREASRVIRENAAAFLRAPAPVRPNAQLGIRLWTRAEGPFGIYEQVAPAFWKLVEQGKQPGLVIQNKR